MLKKIDSGRAATIDQFNPRRLIRALEIAKTLGRVPKLINRPLPANLLIIGLTHERTNLAKRINKRLFVRLKQGLVKEVKLLHKQGLSWSRLDSFGLEYRLISSYLRGLINRKQMIEQLQRASLNFARRQMTWFKKIPNVHWLENPKRADYLVKNLLTK